jgi:glycosyltransferase involved in cell wall biosynthesis
MQNLKISLFNLKHIVFVSREFPPSLRAGGIATYVKEISTALIDQNIQVTVICASDNTQEQTTYIENGVTIIRLSGGDFYLPKVEKNPFLIKKLRFVYRFFSYRYKIRRIIQNLEKVSLIEAAEFGAEGLFLQNIKIPLIIRLHLPALFDRKLNKVENISFQNFHRYWIGLLEFYIVKRAKFITSCSQSLKNWFVSEQHLQEDMVKVIYNPIQLQSYLPILKEFYDKQITIFFAGSILAEKGVQELINAVKMLRVKGYNIKLNLAGKINDIQWIQKEQNAYCNFLGILERDDLYKYYHDSTICCFPSWVESLSYVCLEAMSVGGIVVGSSNGGMTEIIQDGENGFLCPPLNVPQLAQTIEKALNLSEKQRNDMSNNAITTIQNNFSKEVIINQMIDYYMLCTK